MSARSFAVFIVALGVVGLLGFGLLSQSSGALEVGEPIPDTDLPKLNKGSGEGRIADYRGDWVLVNVWASWCVPCRTEAPELQKFYEKNRDRGFTVLGIDIQDTTSDARKFIDEFGLTYPNLRDPEDTRFQALGMRGLPESFLVDPQGNVALIRPGPVTVGWLRDNVAPLLKRGRA